MKSDSIIIEIFPGNDPRTIYFNSLSTILDIKYYKFIDGNYNKFDIFWM